MIDDADVTWWNSATLALTNAMTALAVGIGAWFAARRKVSADSSAIFQDKEANDLLHTMSKERKMALAERDAAMESSRRMMDLRMEDTRTIVRLETQTESMRTRMEMCEAASLRAEARATEAEERSRALSEQLLYSHMRGRALFAEISRLDPVVAAKIVKDQLDVRVTSAAEDVARSQPAPLS